MRTVQPNEAQSMIAQEDILVSALTRWCAERSIDPASVTAKAVSIELKEWIRSGVTDCDVLLRLTR